jgi:hypothetical protein
MRSRPSAMVLARHKRIRGDIEGDVLHMLESVDRFAQAETLLT